MAAPEIRQLVDRGWLCTLSSNHFIQQFFDPMTAYTGSAKYILGEFGIGFTLVVAVMAAYFWTRRAEVARLRPGVLAATGGGGFT